MERVVQGTAATIANTFSVDGVATAPLPDTATIKITRADGTVLVAAGTATTAVSTGKFSYTLSPAQTALLDRLTVEWTATLSGVAQTLRGVVEVAGGVLFTIAEARQDATLSSTASFPTERLVAARTQAELALEHACGVAFVPRYERETTSGTYSEHLPLRWPLLRAIRTASVDGTALTAAELAEVTRTSIGTHWDNRWARGFSNVVVGYEHGYDYPPGECSRVAIRLAKHYLSDAPIDDRAIRVDADNGSWSMATPGIRGQRFGIPEVDAFVSAYGYAVLVA